jgi:peptidoglycan hydrolase-like protein with peptidoglycan-binding domain
VNDWSGERGHQRRHLDVKIVDQGGIMAEPVLRLGSSGDAVRQLQSALRALGFDPGAVDGQFGPRTEAAVKAFQRAQGIAVDGVVGDITWLNIDEADTSNPTIRRGSTGNPVRRAQKRLTLGGYDTKGVDGIFGADTEAAVRRFQRDRALTVDGIVGPRTWAEIDALGD